MSNNREWESLKQRLPKGTRLATTVERHCPFGIFVTIPGVPFKGLVQIVDFKDEERMTPEEYPAVGSEIECVVLGFKDLGQQIWLGRKPSQLAEDKNESASDSN